MATTVVKDYNIHPYYDDFNETKNFHRILFQPGYAVQARELTQMQTLLQAQLDRFGQWAFKDGSKVVLGTTTINVGDTALDFIKIETVFTRSSTVYTVDSTYLNGLVDKTITGATSGTKFEVVKVVASSGSDPHTLYGNYVTSGTNNTTSVFAVGEVLATSDSSPVYTMVGGGTDTDGSGTDSTISTPIGKGSWFNISEGVYFIQGCFVYVKGESLVLDKYGATPSYQVGLSVAEETIKPAADTSLLDAAIGAPNHSAPGADRYKITTTLIKDPVDLASRATNDYISLAKIVAGVVSIDKSDDPEVKLSQRLATRTDEESGSYTVNPFILTVEDHASDATKANIKIGTNISYVNGFRVETTDAEGAVVVDKPRASTDTRDDNLYQQTFNVGNYIKLNANSDGMPDVENFDTIDLFDATGGSGGAGTIRGTARVRSMERVSAENRAYLFDVQMNSNYSMTSMRSVEWKDGSTVKFRSDFLSGAEGKLFDSGNNGLVFKLPFTAIKSMRDPGNNAQTNSSYTIKRYLTTSNNSNAFTLSGGDLFVNTGTILASTFNTSGNAMGDTGVATVTSSNGGATLTITHIGGVAVSLNSTTSIKFVASVSRSDILEKTKALQTNGSVSGTLTNGRLSLAKADIKKIKTITANSVSVMDRFDLDNGQRDNFYDVGGVELRTGYSDPGTIAVTFDYYTHGAGDYFSADSYPTYTEIPDFTSITGTHSLRDCVDFRPRMNDAGTGFTGTGSTTAAGIIGTATAFICDVTHYLGRVDILSMSQTGAFTITKGVSSVNPSGAAARVPAKDISIAEIILSPYVFTNNQINPRLVDNKRYTMRDIARLDKRIKNLEYYTSLSLLEQSAADVQLYDAAGDSRLKNGFIVDNFHGYRVADASHPDFSVAMDKEAGMLHPQGIMKTSNLVRLSSEANGTTSNNKALKNGAGVVTLPFTEATQIDQPYSSFYSNVNPYNVFSWAGVINLSPETDEWKETDIRPTVFVDDTQAYDQFVQMAEEEGILGTVWNEWQTNWSGTETSTSVEEVNRIIQGNGGEGREQQGTQTTTTTTTTTNQSASGLQTSVGFDTIHKSSGNKLVEVNFIPFIRSRKVMFKAELLKPLTKVYAFFGGKSITNYVRAETFVEFSDQTSVTTYGGETAHPSGANALVSNSNGVVEGSFIIPRNDTLKFATGTREFRLSDDVNNNKDTETTYAQAHYHATGLLESFQETITSTKVPKLEYQEVSKNQVLTDVDTQQTTEWEDPLAETMLIDEVGGIFASSVDIFFRAKAPSTGVPVRLTIRETRNGIPTQRVVAGADKILYPGSVNIPSDMTANDSIGNANNATTFTFPFPVYLGHQKEYAIVLTAQCDDYEVYVAQMGGTDLTDNTKRITKQPYNGVFFSSQNASTWTPEQSRDLKFKLKKAQFTTGNHTLTMVNDVVPLKKLATDPFYTTNSSGNILVEAKNHGMYTTGSSVIIAGVAADFNGVDKDNINGTHSITAFTHDTFTFVAANSDTASATGYGGGSNNTSTENIYMDLMDPFIENFTVPGTSVTYSAQARTGESLNGSESAYQVKSAFDISPWRNHYFDAPHIVGSQIQETNNMSGNKSLTITATLSTTNANLSPVIDLNRSSVLGVQNKISSTGGAETTATGGGEICKYITKKIELNEPADMAKVYINTSKPAGSNIDLYYRQLPEAGDMASTTWTIQAPDVAMPDREVFDETSYTIDPTGEFSSIQFKIVLRSTNSSKVPLIKDFRAICAT